MNKAVLISVQPKWCDKIAGGEKTVEVRKNRPKLKTPFKVYIYRTKGFMRHLCGGEWFNMPVGGHVIGEFMCDKITYFGNVSTDPWRYLQGSTHEELKRIVTQDACLSECEMLSYRGKYGWHISGLVIYNKPRELSSFVVEGDCDCVNCKKCVWFDKGNGYNVEDDCSLAYEAAHRKESLKPLFRPPQSWCYVEDLSGGSENA